MLTSTFNQLWGVVTLNLYGKILRNQTSFFRKLFRYNKNSNIYFECWEETWNSVQSSLTHLLISVGNSFGEIIKCNLGNLCSMENCRFVIFLTSTFIYRNWFVSTMSTLNYARKTCDINHGFFRLSDQECKMLLPSMNMPRHYTSSHHSQNQPH